VGIHVLVFFLGSQSDLATRLVSVQEKELTTHYHTMVHFHQRIDRNLDHNRIIFIGDSLIQGLAVSAITESGVNFGIGNDTTKGVLQRLSKYDSINWANAIVLSIGLNDFKYRKIDQAIENYRTILDGISSTKPIIISAILPVDESVQPHFNNTAIKVFNHQLAEITKEYSNVSYLDVGRHLSTAGGLLKKYHIGDGIHLNQAGNRLWIEQLKKCLNKKLISMRANK